MSRGTLVRALFVVLGTTGMSLAGWWHLSRNAPAALNEDAGIVLMQGRPGYVQKILLGDSGRYAITTECDVCDGRPSVGTWKKSGERYVLQNSEGSVVLELDPDKVRDCDVLVPHTRNSQVSQPSVFYFRLGDPCLMVL